MSMNSLVRYILWAIDPDTITCAIELSFECLKISCVTCDVHILELLVRFLTAQVFIQCSFRLAL